MKSNPSIIALKDFENTSNIQLSLARYSTAQGPRVETQVNESPNVRCKISEVHLQHDAQRLKQLLIRSQHGAQLKGTSTTRTFFFSTSNFCHALQHKSPTSECELSKIFRLKFSPRKTLWFFFRNFSFNFLFFRTPAILHLHLSPPPPHTLKIFFGDLDFFSNTPTLDIFLWLQEKLSECSSANNRQVLVKYRM